MHPGTLCDPYKGTVISDGVTVEEGMRDVADDEDFADDTLDDELLTELADMREAAIDACDELIMSRTVSTASTTHCRKRVRADTSAARTLSFSPVPA